ncbi:ankyrin repeat and SOCS box protein 2-like isoform X1 [Lates japonicus]|uniref:Ankyrin repeat and SOCS box protein 2-like isoform X1 n=1 Tax=Lates japonicus TaxID=270547 RepID=A0AAD3R9Q0_LATJO|nr:ankyrin repeat and SOCS box protein 2-like isoform X1 [Lates japonicus]
MTKFCYSEYLSQFRNAGGKCNNVLSRLRGDRGRRDSQSDETSEPEDVDPVVFAIRRGDVEAVNDLAASAPHSLLKENKDGWIPLHDAAYCGQAECLRTLLRGITLKASLMVPNVHPGSVDKRTLQEQTALLLAVSCEHLSCVRCLLEAGADPDISSKNKETPLYKACELENMDMVSLILSYGATVNQRCGQGWTALHEAVSRNNTQLCEVLLRAGAAINPPNTYSITPLTVAAQQGQMRALCYLIEKGADVNMQTCDGVTALHEASKNGHKEIVAVLLTKNADANKPTNSGLLPLHIAAQYGHHEIVSLLVSVTSRARLRHSWISPLHLAAEHIRHTVAAVPLRQEDVNATLAHSHSIHDRRRQPSASMSLTALKQQRDVPWSLCPVPAAFAPQSQRRWGQQCIVEDLVSVVLKGSSRNTLMQCLGQLALQNEAGSWRFLIGTCSTALPTFSTPSCASERWPSATSHFANNSPTGLPHPYSAGLCVASWHPGVLQRTASVVSQIFPVIHGASAREPTYPRPL